jgi:type I restriction enzyme S subunit
MTSIEETKALAPWTEALPPDWRAIRLDAVADVLFSNVDKHTIEGEVPVRLCNYVDVYKNERITDALDFMEASAEPREIRKFQIRCGDTLATKDSEEPDDIAIPALVAEELPGVLCGYHLALIRPRLSTVSGPFLTWLHSCKSFRAQYEARAVGVTRFGLPEYAFRAARVPLPSLPEQQRITAYLNASCAAIDAAVAAKRHQLETLDALRKTTITHAITRGQGDDVELESTGNVWMTSIPRKWNLVCLKRISDIQTGLTLGKTYEGPLIERPYLRVANVQDGRLDLDDVTLIEVPSAVAARVELRAGDVLMTEGGDLDKLGRGYLWDGQIPNCLHQNHIFAVRCFAHKLRPMFLTYATASQYGRDYFEATGKRTTNLASTSSTKVGLFPIPLPPITEQDEICGFLGEKLAELRRISGGIEAQIETLTAYRKSLIHECVTGQRRVTEADLQRAGGAQSFCAVRQSS